MNTKTREYADKIAEVVKTFPEITKAAVVGPATHDTFIFNDNLMLAVFTEPDAKYTKVCVDLNNALENAGLTKVDIYMTADEDFYAEVFSFMNSVEDSEVIYEK